MKVSKQVSYQSYHPIYMILSLVLGAGVGFFFKGFAKDLNLFANMYLSLLQMCLIPLVLTAIPVALSRIVKMKIAGHLFLRLVIVFIVTSLIVSFLGVLCGIFAHHIYPITHDSLVNLGAVLISQSPIDSSEILHSGLSAFFKDLVPSNIFAAVVQGKSIQILVFSVFLGFALGLLALDVSNPAIRVYRGIYKTFVNIVSAILIILPLGVFFLMGAYIANFPYAVWLNLKGMVIANLAGSFLVGIVLLWCMAYWLNRSFYYAFKKLKSVLLVSLFSFSGFVVLPLVLRVFGRNFDLDEEEVSLFYPLSVALHPLGSVFFFSLFTVFITHIYGYHMTIFDMIKTILFSLFATIPIGGLYYRLPKSMLYLAMSMLLHPMGLPASTAVLMMVVGHALFFPIVNVVNVIGNCLSVALIVRNRRYKESHRVNLESVSS